MLIGGLIKARKPSEKELMGCMRVSLEHKKRVQALCFCSCVWEGGIADIATWEGPEG